MYLIFMYNYLRVFVYSAVDPVMSKHISRIMLSIVLVTIIILTVLGNLLVMVALCKDRQLR